MDRKKEQQTGHAKDHPNAHTFCLGRRWKCSETDREAEGLIGNSPFSPFHAVEFGPPRDLKLFLATIDSKISF
jgi:hypothetical protein